RPRMDSQSSAADRIFTPRSLARLAAVWLVAVVVLKLLGRSFLSDSGFGIWTGASTPNTSQWLADPYSSSHVLHGIFFSWMLLPLARWLSAPARVVAAMVIEAGWEVFENTPFVIERYRANTASLDYYGDSIMNSSCDILCALVGYWIAWRFGWKVALAVIV